METVESTHTEDLWLVESTYMLDLFAPRVDSTGRTHPPLADSFDASGDCWDWLGYRNPAGYGRAKSKATGEVLAHRIVWTYLVGPIPAGLTLDHLCRNHGCVNPDHLEVVTGQENTRRGRHHRVWICPQGHDKRIVGRYPASRVCAQCARDRAREYGRLRRARTSV